MVPQPATQSGVVYLRDGRAHLETTAVYPDGEELPANTDARLAERVPADAFVFAQHADVGSQASHLADCLRDSRGGGQAGEALEGLGDHLELIENLDAWAAGGALVVRYDGSRLGAGALIRIEDEARAQAALAELRSTLAEAPGVVSITESEHAGITIIDVTFKADADGPGREPAAPDAVLSWALTNDTLVIGMDGSFTRAVLDTTAETSLRNDAAYRAATEASGGFSHAGSAYLDMQAALTVSRAFELGRGSDQGDEEFLGAIDNVVAVARVNGRSITTHVVLTPLE